MREPQPMAAGISILILEDDQDLRSVLTDYLEDDGFQVVPAGDGQEAVQQALRKPFDLMVLDVKLPGPDGLEVLAQLKEQNPELLSIVMTGFATERDTVRALRLGVGDYLQKPFPPDDLLRAVARMATIIHQRRELSRRERSARELVMLALEIVVGSHALETTERGGPLSMAQKARRAALAHEFSDAAANALYAAVLLVCLRRSDAPTARLEQFQVALPEEVAQLAQDIESAHHLESTPEPSTGNLGFLGAAVLSGHLEDELPNPPEDQSESHDEEPRHLLLLGRTLMASGDTAAAEEAFQALARGRRSREAGQALVELSRLAWQAGDFARTRACLRELVRLLEFLGPEARAELQLEGGLFAMDLGLQEGGILLQRAAEAFGRLELHASRAAALLAFAIGQPNPGLPESAILRGFLEPEAGRALRQDCSWLLSRLLRLRAGHDEPLLSRVVDRLLLELPSATSRLLEVESDQAVLKELLEGMERLGLTPDHKRLRSLDARIPKSELRPRIEALLRQGRGGRTPTLRLYSLGHFEVWLGDRQIRDDEWLTSKVRYLLAFLASREGRPVHQEALIEQFWPGFRQERGKKNLYQTASSLKRTLNGSEDGGNTEWLARKHELLSLDQERAVWHDLDVFHDNFQRAQSHLDKNQVREAHPFLRQAAQLIRGAYLEDCPLEWAVVKRREVDAQVSRCLMALAQSSFKLGLMPEALETTQKLLQLDSLYQEAHQLCMETLLELGRPEQAMRHYEEARQVLFAELGIEPSIELVRLFHLAKLGIN